MGETALAPAQRFEKHKARGLIASRVVYRHGRRLRPDLVNGVGPFTSRAEAVEAEARVAEQLRTAGFTVFGGQGRTFP